MLLGIYLYLCSLISALLFALNLVLFVDLKKEKCQDLVKMILKPLISWVLVHLVQSTKVHMCNRNLISFYF